MKVSKWGLRGIKILILVGIMTSMVWLHELTHSTIYYEFCDNVDLSYSLQLSGVYTILNSEAVCPEWVAQSQANVEALGYLVAVPLYIIISYLIIQRVEDSIEDDRDTDAERRYRAGEEHQDMEELPHIP